MMSDASGRQTLVESNRPPRPTSTTAKSTRRRHEVQEAQSGADLEEGQLALQAADRRPLRISSIRAASSAGAIGLAVDLDALLDARRGAAR